MNAHAPTLTFTTRPQRLTHRLVALLTRLYEALRRMRRRSRLLHELQALDDHMLRDIGLHRGEIDSVVAEVIGAAPATRRRVLIPRRGA